MARGRRFAPGQVALACPRACERLFPLASPRAILAKYSCLKSRILFDFVAMNGAPAGEWERDNQACESWESAFCGELLSAVMDRGWETKREIRNAFEAQGLAFSERKMERWREERLLPRVDQIPLAYRGSDVRYPPGTAAQAMRFKICSTRCESSIMSAGNCGGEASKSMNDIGGRASFKLRIGETSCSEFSNCLIVATRGESQRKQSQTVLFGLAPQILFTLKSNGGFRTTNFQPSWEAYSTRLPVTLAVRLRRN